MSDRTNQLVLGVFVSIFVYCLIVLRTIRVGDDGAFVPSLAVLGGIVLSFVGIGFLIYFIHHIATSVQAAYIVAGVAIAIGLCARRQLPGCRDGRADRRGGRGLGQAALHRGCPGRSKQPTGRDVTGSVTTACDAPADRAVPQR